MNYIKNKKGQGGDTFKLLIAAVVAMVILGIVTGVFQNIWDLVFGITCVSNPINEMTTKIQRAQAEIITATGTICVKSGEGFKDTALTNKVTNVNSLEFVCEGDAVCKDENSAVDVTSSAILARRDAKFRGLIDCQKSGQNYDCTIIVQSA